MGKQFISFAFTVDSKRTDRHLKLNVSQLDYLLQVLPVARVCLVLRKLVEGL